MDLSKYFPIILILFLINIKIGNVIIIIFNNCKFDFKKKDQKHKK